MESRKELMIKEVKEISQRIEESFNKYYEKFYLKPEKSVCEELYGTLSNAFASNGSSLCSNILKEEIFEGINKEKDTNFHMCMNYLKQAVYIVLTHYNSSLASSTERTLRTIKNYSKELLSLKNVIEINDLIKDISQENYIREHEEFEKIKELFDLIKIFNEDVKRRDLLYIHELMGAKLFFELLLSNVSSIDTINDKYFKSTVCEYFRNHFEFRFK